MSYTGKDKRAGHIKAEPNPVPISDFGRYGSTTLSWTSNGVRSIEIHVHAPDGRLICRGGRTGSIYMKRSVKNKTVFFYRMFRAVDLSLRIIRWPPLPFTRLTRGLRTDFQTIPCSG
jgi:hypothetical protein